jgi:spore coat polysaccharide biosynthesis protein SpsF
MTSRTLVVVQARTGSSRLPGKVLKQAAGRTLLAHMLDRVSAARTSFQLVVATTVLADDDAIVAECRTAGVCFFRGHPTDLLDRHFHAALGAKADVVVKIPSDCPLIDPHAIDAVLSAFDPSDHDFVSNLHPPSWPDGNDVEVMSIAALERAFVEARAPHEREHTTPYFWEGKRKFRTANVCWDEGLDLSASHRFVLDYPEDYLFIRSIFDELYDGGRVFDTRDIIALLDRHPSIRDLNAMHLGKSWHSPMPPVRAIPRDFEPKLEAGE